MDFEFSFRNWAENSAGIGVQMVKLGYNVVDKLLIHPHQFNQCCKMKSLRYQHHMICMIRQMRLF